PSVVYRDNGADVDVGGVVPISALHGTGLDELLLRVEQAVITRTQREMWRVVLPVNGPELSWLHGEPGATVCDVSPIATAKPHPQDSETLPLTTQDDVIATDDDVMTEYLSVKVILTETANSKFQARFSSLCQNVLILHWTHIRSY
ncbi:hypothetical protein GBAR_LOCUS31468, partial [Geodia barretti]